MIPLALGASGLARDNRGLETHLLRQQQPCAFTVVCCTHVIFYVCPNVTRLGSHGLGYETFLPPGDIKTGLPASFSLLFLWTTGKKQSSAVGPGLGWHRQFESVEKVLRCPPCHPLMLGMARAAQSQRWKWRLQASERRARAGAEQWRRVWRREKGTSLTQASEAYKLQLLFLDWREQLWLVVHSINSIHSLPCAECASGHFREAKTINNDDDDSSWHFYSPYYVPGTVLRSLYIH